MKAEIWTNGTDYYMIGGGEWATLKNESMLDHPTILRVGKRKFLKVIPNNWRLYAVEV